MNPESQRAPLPPHRASALAVLVLALLVAVSGGCFVDRAPEGARATPDGTGPRVVFELTKRPLPDIPQPNDVATFADPSSRTGRRVNASMVAPTRMESFARGAFATLEGWGTFAPITVAFDREEGADETTPAIDLDDVRARTRDADPRDDPFYVIDLETGTPALIDVGRGRFPITIAEPDRYFTNDPRAKADALLFETHEEGFGLPQSAYRPELDTDFDGVLDHPNVLRANGGQGRAEDILTFYERETDTLILRPIVPLHEKREYAVVLTDRLRGAKGGAVRSPFPFVHHPQQRRGADRVRDVLSRADGARFFGDIAGSGLDHVAFVWTFTTQPVYEDMRLLRDGLHGAGPFARLATEFPPDAKALQSVGFAREAADEPPGAVDADPKCAGVKKTPYIVRVADTKDTLREVIETAVGVRGEELRRLMQSLDEVDYFVIGTFESPYLLGDPERESPNDFFDVDFKTGAGRVRRDTVQYWLSVPKRGPGRAQPFPVTVWAHGTTLHADEIIVRAGYFAKQGQAMFGINMPGHGLLLEPGQATLAEVLLRKTCMVRWAGALTKGRHRDLNADGVADSGGLLWTAHIFHSRDNIRQSVIDELQATRVLRAFDGRRGTQDTNGDGIPDLAGDFDGDGVPDVGGPNVAISTSGNSFGGILAMVHGAVDPNVTAAAPISGGGGLTDIATRSALVPDSVIEQVISPLLVSVPASSIKESRGDPRTRCSKEQRSVRLVVNDLTSSREIEIACLTQAELDAGKTVVLTNVTNGEKRCARTGEEGRFRVPIPASVGDRLDVQLYDKPDVVVSYKGCEVLEGAPVGRRISRFEQAATQPRPVKDERVTCEAAFAATDLEENRGCAQFRDQFYPVGSPLVAPQEGLGLHRQSPEMRRLFALTQAALDPGDPVNFAPYYALRDAPGVSGAPLGPRAVVEWNTVGDPFVPVGTGYAFARAAGALPFLPPGFATTYPEWADYATPRGLYDQLGGRTPEDILVDRFVIEGLSRMRRSSAGPTCTANYVSSPACTSPPSTSDCAQALVDVDWLSEGKDLFDAPRLPVPLRLGRAASVRARDEAQLALAWRARLAGSPFAPDETAWDATAPLVGVINAYNDPGGLHVWVNGDPCKAFDDAVYYTHALVRFLATGGKDLYFLSHPRSHTCLERESCPFFTP